MAVGVGGQEERLWLYNRGELQTLNVEWQSHKAAVYQRTLQQRTASVTGQAARVG